MGWAAILALALPMALLAQAPGTVQASGTATLYANPDQAQLSVGVVTDAGTAQAAAQSNAAITTAVVNALKQILGSGGSLQTVGYSVTPRYSQGQSPAIVGYTVSNTIQVT